MYYVYNIKAEKEVTIEADSREQADKIINEVGIYLDVDGMNYGETWIETELVRVGE